MWKYYPFPYHQGVRSYVLWGDMCTFFQSVAMYVYAVSCATWEFLNLEIAHYTILETQ